MASISWPAISLRWVPTKAVLGHQRRQAVAHEAIENTTRLLRFDQGFVDIPRILQSPLDGAARDLVKDHALGLAFWRQLLDQVPANGLSLAVFVSGQVEGVCFFELLLQLFEGFFRSRIVDDVDRLEVVLRIHPQPCPGLFLEFLGHLLGVFRQISHVAQGGQNAKIVWEIFFDGLRL